MKSYKIILPIVFSILVAKYSFARSRYIELTFATDNSHASPYVNGPGNIINNKYPGIEIELYRLIAKELNIKINFVRAPWTRCLHELKNTKIDALFPASFKKKRTKFANYPMNGVLVDKNKKLRNENYVLYTLNNSKIKWNGKKITNLHGPIGVTKDWSISSDLKKMNISTLPSKSPRNNLKKLLMNRVAGVASIESIFDKHINNNKNIKKNYPPLKTKEYYLIFSKKFYNNYPDLAEKIWSKIVSTKKTKKYKEILTKYLNIKTGNLDSN